MDDADVVDMSTTILGAGGGGGGFCLGGGGGGGGGGRGGVFFFFFFMGGGGGGGGGMELSAIFRHDGNVDKFVGDAILAVVGRPESDPDQTR